MTAQNLRVWAIEQASKMATTDKHFWELVKQFLKFVSTGDTPKNG